MVMDWLRKIAARSPEPLAPAAEPKRHVDILLSAERDAILASHLTAPLAALGLVQVAPRRWVDGSAPPVRRVFEMRLLKGASTIANWAFHSTSCHISRCPGASCAGTNDGITATAKWPGRSRLCVPQGW
jgi:hypothetical protein